jgi:hypothetical protein
MLRDPGSAIPGAQVSEFAARRPTGLKRMIGACEGRRGSCIRFSGPGTLTGERVSFGPLISTKLACVEESLTAQENRFLEALDAAERYVVDGSELRIYVRGNPAPLRFSRTPAP